MARGRCVKEHIKKSVDFMATAAAMVNAGPRSRYVVPRSQLKNLAEIINLNGKVEQFEEWRIPFEALPRDFPGVVETMN